MTGFAAWVNRRRSWVLALGLAITLLSGWRTVLTYAGLKSDLEELLPRDAPSVAALDTLRARLPGVRYLGIVVDTGGPANLAAANRFIDELKQRIVQYPPDMVAAVRADVTAERQFAETYALQLMDPPDVRRLREAVERRRDWEVRHAMGIELLDENEDPRPALPIDELRAKYEERHGKQHSFPGDRLVSDDGHTAVLLVRTGGHTTSYEADAALLRRVKADVQALRFPAAYAAGMRLGYAGDVATRVEELEGLRADLSISGVLAVGLVLYSLRWFFGSWWSVLVLGLPLLGGTLCTFGLVALPPLSIRHLNSNTGFLGSVIVGNGINTGIILLARYVEERQRGSPPDTAMGEAVRTTWRATLATSAAASAAYGSLVFTQFRGFNQFGWIGGLGMLTCWVCMYLLVPVLAGLVGTRWRCEPKPPRAPGRRLLELSMARPGWVLAFTGVATLVAAAGFWWRGSDWLENDFSRLRRRDSFVSGERYWGERMDRTLHTYLTPTVILTSSPEQAERTHDALVDLQRAGRAGGLIASVRSARDVLPRGRVEALAEARRLKQVITRRMLGELKSDEKRMVESALSEAALRPLAAAQIPDVLVTGLRENDGSLDKSVLVFPELTAGTWQGARLGAFTRDLREAASADPGAQVAGSLVLSSDLTQSMGRDGPRASYLGLAAALLICALAFGSVRLSLVAMGSLIVGVGLMMGLLGWTKARLNFANFVVLPITFGVAVDYAINVLRRFQTEGSTVARAALANTGAAVGLCSATTIIGFGSLLAAQNQGLFSFGVFATMGEIMTLATATLALPAWLAMRENQREERARGLLRERSDA